MPNKMLIDASHPEETRVVVTRGQKVEEFAREASAQVEHARMVFDDLNGRALAFIRERPGVALLGALAVGYLVGKIASKAK